MSRRPSTTCGSSRRRWMIRKWRRGRCRHRAWMPQSCSPARRMRTSRASCWRTPNPPSSAAHSARRPSSSAKRCFSGKSSCARSRRWFRANKSLLPLMVRSRAPRGVSNHEAPQAHPSRRGKDAAPQDEEESKNMQKRNATCAVIGAGDYIGAEIAKKFAAEGFTVFAGRRNGEKLEPLVKEVEAAGGAIFGRSLDARKEEEITAFLNDADKHAPLEVCIFNVGANVKFPILETTERVFRKVWEMACWAGFLAGRESARLMLPRGRGNIFFTGATASLRGGSGFAAFASAKFGLRAVAQSMARELGPQNIHVAHLIIDSGVDTAWVRERREQMWGKEALNNPDLLMPPASVAASYWQLYQQPKSAWTFEMEIRPFGEKW